MNVDILLNEAGAYSGFEKGGCGARSARKFGFAPPAKLLRTPLFRTPPNWAVVLPNLGGGAKKGNAKQFRRGCEPKFAAVANRISNSGKKVNLLRKKRLG